MPKKHKSLTVYIYIYIPLKQGTLKKQGSSDCSVKSGANGKNQVLHLPSTENVINDFQLRMFD